MAVEFIQFIVLCLHVLGHLEMGTVVCDCANCSVVCMLPAALPLLLHGWGQLKFVV